MLLLHGTTLKRAQSIVANGPNPEFREPGGQAKAEGFSTNVATGPFHYGHPKAYALQKALLFPDEGGPVIVQLDVPIEIIAKVSAWYPVGEGLIQFDPGAGLEELIASWPNIHKSIERIS